MRALFKFIRQHISEDFNVLEYGLMLLFLIISIGLNYRYDFVDDVIQHLHGLTKTFYYFIFYSTAYFGATLIIVLTKPGSRFFNKPEYWYRSIFALMLLSLDSSVPFLREGINATVAPPLQFWANKVAVNLISGFTIFLPLLVFWRFYQDSSTHFYGLASRHFDMRPYLYMLLIMTPILIAASFHSSFLHQYPMYKISRAHEFLQIPEWVTVAIYEIAYGLDFITVELLFRGFLVIGMAKVLGRNAVITMAVVYCFLHFGKPPGEAISSVFGGYILGVIALETKSIWGGIMVHLGIAWMMEGIAFIQKSI